MTMMMILPYWDKWSHFICAYHLFSWDTIIPHSSYLVFLLSIRQLTITTGNYFLILHAFFLIKVGVIFLLIFWLESDNQNPVKSLFPCCPL